MSSTDQERKLGHLALAADVDDRMVEPDTRLDFEAAGTDWTRAKGSRKSVKSAKEEDGGVGSGGGEGEFLPLIDLNLSKPKVKLRFRSRFVSWSRLMTRVDSDLFFLGE